MVSKKSGSHAGSRMVERRANSNYLDGVGITLKLFEGRVVQVGVYVLKDRAVERERSQGCPTKQQLAVFATAEICRLVSEITNIPEYVDAGLGRR
jgi:hypothetical protein